MSDKHRSMTAFDTLHIFVENQGLLPGMCFDTGGFGRVPYGWADEAKTDTVSIIPDELQEKALRNGFCIVAADHKRDVYTFRVMSTRRI